MPPRKRQKTESVDQAAAADPAAQPQPGVHIQASATVGQAEGTAHVTGAIVNAPNAQEVQIHLPPVTPALHHLRAPVGDFVGRAVEIAQLTEAVRQAIGSGAMAAISGVRGMGGIGKTELAYVVAHELARDFPDAQIVVELRGASDPLAPIQALQTAIRFFEPETRLSDDLAELQSRYRSHLSGKHALILADDARDAAQVRPLLPPSGSVLLVTSRYRFSLPGMHTIDLGMLAPKEAEALLLAICRRIGEAAPALAKLCGYLPLALRVSAGLLASDATLLMARYLKQLADEQQRLVALRDSDDPELNVAASLALSYVALDPALQITFCQLGVFAANFDRAAAQAIVRLEGEQAIDDVLGGLYRRSLIDYDVTQERYNLHDLVRVFALVRLKDECEVRLRHAQYYLLVANQAQHLYRQGKTVFRMGLALFDRERIQIDTSWAWLRSQTPDQTINELLIAYSDATGYTGDVRYDMRWERIPQLEAMLAAARWLERKKDEGRALSSLGSAYKQLGDARTALSYYELVRTITHEIGDRQSESYALGNLGITYSNLGEARIAIGYHEQHLAIAREIGDRRGEGNALGNLGLAYAVLGDASIALSYYEQQLAIVRELGDRRNEGNALGNVGKAYTELGDALKAIAYHKQHLTIAREIGDRRGEGNALSNIGRSYIVLGDASTALICYKQALSLAHSIGNQAGVAYASWYLGLIYEQQGDLTRAINFMQVRVDYQLSIKHAQAGVYAAQIAAIRQRIAAGDEGTDLPQ